MISASSSFGRVQPKAHAPIDERVSFLDGDVSGFDDLLLDQDFDIIGALDLGNDEFRMYRDVDALPKGYSAE